MGCFDDIPEDKSGSYPCPNDCGGDVIKDYLNKGWQCIKCAWFKSDEPENQKSTHQNVENILSYDEHEERRVSPNGVCDDYEEDVKCKE